jgi:hypothetical protein
MPEALIREFYRSFNERRLADAAALFSGDAVLDHVRLRQKQQGGDGYLLFAETWLRAFPDAQIGIERISPALDGMYEVDLVASGTHRGPLDLDGGILFKPTGVEAMLHLRQLLQFRESKITYSSLSFDLRDIVQQLVHVDVSQLLEHLRRVSSLTDRLAAIPADDQAEQRNVLHRIGSELDDARHVLRPYFKR